MARSFAANVLGGAKLLAAAGFCLAPSMAQAVSCTVATLPANFGIYDPFQATPASTTGEIDVSCTCSVVDCIAFSFRVEIAAGASGSTAARQMRSGAASLQYNLYLDPGYRSIWGIGSEGYSVLYLIALFGSKQVTTVYARMPAGQMAAPGVYSDAPVVTVSY